MLLLNIYIPDLTHSRQLRRDGEVISYEHGCELVGGMKHALNIARKPRVRLTLTKFAGTFAGVLLEASITISLDSM